MGYRGTNFRSLQSQEGIKKKSQLSKSADFFDRIKTSQINLPVGGQVKTNLPGSEPAKGGPICNVCGAQLPNPTEPSNQAKGNLTNCSQCGAPIKNPGTFKQPFGQQKQQTGFNQHVSVQAQTTPMPTNSKVVSMPGNPMFERRIKKPALQPTIQDAVVSDENAENTTSHHLDSVSRSADALGL